MMEKLFNHPGWLKVVSLLMAVLLWLYVMPRYMEETQRSFEVRLNVIKNASPNLVWLEEDSLPSTVTIKVDGRNYALRGLSRENFKATLDLNQVADTNKTTPLEVRVEAPGVPPTQYENLSVTPKTISVTLVETKSISIPVSVSPQTDVIQFGGDDWRYTASSEVANVELAGRSDYLALVKTALASLKGVELNPDLKRVSIGVSPVDSAGKPVKVNAQKVTIILDWEKLPPGRSFKIHPVTQGTLPAGLTLGTVVVEPAAVVLRAMSPDAKPPAQDTVDTEPIDLTGRTKSFSATVKLVPVPGTTPTNEPVNVTVNIEEVQAEKVFKGVPLDSKGGPTGAAVQLAVTDVQIRVQGPYSVVNKIDPESLKAFVDLESVGPGKHSLPVKVLFPPDVTTVVADPPVIDVTITMP